jgi:hypothetical protein
VSTAWHIIWKLRVNCVITNPDRTTTLTEIHNQWLKDLKAVNKALQQDCLLTDRVRFVSLALSKQLVLNTWSGLLIDEDSLLDDQTKEGF